MGVDEFDDLVLRPDLAGCYFIELVAQSLQLTFDDGIVDLIL